MEGILNRIAAADWDRATEAMHEQGYALLPKLLTGAECDGLKAGYDDQDYYRKTVVMERYRFGLGEYKYFRYPLPGLLAQLREGIYSRLAPPTPGSGPCSPTGNFPGSIGSCWRNAGRRASSRPPCSS